MAIVGVVDVVSPMSASGWAYLDDAPQRHLKVQALLDGAIVGEAFASDHRPDLAEAGVGEGDHAFEVLFEPALDQRALGGLIVRAVADTGESEPLPLGETPANGGAVGARAIESYAEDAEQLPPVGLPVDWLDAALIGEHHDWTGERDSQVVAALRRDVWPLPHPDNRENYAPDSHLIYWLSGYADYLRLRGMAEKHDVKEGRFFEFGGSTGRIFRNFAQQSQNWEVWSCDFKRSSVAFNMAHFPRDVRVFLNSSTPSLPLPDGYFDLIVAGSVFTHIDDAETAWLLELRRILKIGGLALLTVHNDDTWTHMVPDLRATVDAFRPDVADSPTLPGERLVVRFRFDGDPYNCNVFHSNGYIERNWGRYFDVLEIAPLSFGEQAIVVARRSS